MDSQPHNYLKVIDWISREKAATHAQMDIRYLHDTWCGYLYGKRCDCNPDVLVNGEIVKWPKSLLER